MSLKINNKNSYLWLGCRLGSLGSLVSLVEHFKGVNVLNVALHLLL